MSRSSRAATATGYGISGSGFASAKTIGRSAIERIMSCVTMFGAGDAEEHVGAAHGVGERAAGSCRPRCAASRRSSPPCGPSRRRPCCRRTGCVARSAPSRDEHLGAGDARGARPGDDDARGCRSRLPASSQALSRAAPLMIAVPCWSSWKTGMSSASTSRFSTSKHSGALMSSRLIPPNVGAMRLTTSTSSSTSFASTSMSKTSMPANFLKRTPLPSITGLPARGPMLPSPRMAVPFVITATRLPLFVYR